MNNLLFISRAYGKNAGGMERLSYELISAFPAAEKIVNETRPGQSLFSARVKSVVFAITVIPRALAKARSADVVHIGDPVLLLVAWCIKILCKKPVVCTVHGLDVVYGNSLYQAYIKTFLSACNRYVAISEFAQQKLEERGVAVDRITVIPPGVTNHLYDAGITRDRLADMLHRDISKAVVLATTGRLIERKGHAWFIEHVLPRLPQNVIYIVAGSGPESTTVSQLIEQLHLTDRVMLLGRVSDADQKVLLNTIDAFIQPNIAVHNDIEGFGIAPLEAALCGRQVFASNIDGVPSAIHDGKNGTLLPAEQPEAWVSALAMFAKNPTLNPQAREYTKQEFSWERLAVQYAGVFQQSSI